VSVHKRPLSTAAAAAKSGRPQSTLGTRLERQKRGIVSFCARKKPASPFFLPLGQLPMWFLGRFGLKDFVPLPRVAGLRELRLSRECALWKSGATRRDLRGGEYQ
jgi:hypothetical protein